MKHLLKTGEVVKHRRQFRASTLRIYDFDNKLKRLKAYRLQYDHLGYIVSGSRIKQGRQVIIDYINSRIETPHEGRNTLVYLRCCKYMLGTEWQTLTKHYESALEYLEAIDNYRDMIHVYNCNMDILKLISIDAEIEKPVRPQSPRNEYVVSMIKLINRGFTKS